MSIHNETWSEDDIRELITEYKRRPILWDETLEVKDKRKKAAEWKDLASMFSTTVADIQRRTNNLKSTFFDEEKKMKKMKTARRKSYCPWVHYDDLKFLVETPDRDGTSSESEVVSGKEDHVEHIVPMEIESSDPPSSSTSRLASTRRTMLLSERASKLQPTEKEETTVTRRRTILSETTSRTPPAEENRRILTASRILPNAEKGDAFSRRTLLSERASRLFPSEGKMDFSSSVSPNRGESAQSSPSKTTSPFSTSSSKVAYYPQLGGLANYSPPKRSSLYPDLGSPTRYTFGTENRSESRVDTPSQYSPTKFVTETASRISPETDRITKRRRLSNSDDSPSPSSTKVRKLVRDEDHADENGSVVSQVLSDDYDLFGAFIASEIRNLKHESCKIKLKGMIQRSIVQVAEEDSRMSGK